MGSLRYFTSSYLAGMSLHKEHKFDKVGLEEETEKMIEIKGFKHTLKVDWSQISGGGAGGENKLIKVVFRQSRSWANMKLRLRKYFL